MNLCSIERRLSKACLAACLLHVLHACSNVWKRRNASERPSACDLVLPVRGLAFCLTRSVASLNGCLAHGATAARCEAQFQAGKPMPVRWHGSGFVLWLLQQVQPHLRTFTRQILRDCYEHPFQGEHLQNVWIVSGGRCSPHAFRREQQLDRGKLAKLGWRQTGSRHRRASA